MSQYFANLLSRRLKWWRIFDTITYNFEKKSKVYTAEKSVEILNFEKSQIMWRLNLYREHKILLFLGIKFEKNESRTWNWWSVTDPSLNPGWTSNFINLFEWTSNCFVLVFSVIVKLIAMFVEKWPLPLLIICLCSNIMLKIKSLNLSKPHKTQVYFKLFLFASIYEELQ